MWCGTYNPTASTNQSTEQAKSKRSGEVRLGGMRARKGTDAYFKAPFRPALPRPYPLDPHAASSIFRGSSRYSLTLTATGPATHWVQHEGARSGEGARGRTEEGDRFPPVEEAVVVGERNNHDWADHDLTVDNDWPILDRVHA